MDRPPPHPLKKLRQALDMRQADVAEKAGCSVPMISNVEHGYVPPSLAKQDAIAAAVDATRGDIW